MKLRVMDRAGLLLVTLLVLISHVQSKLQYLDWKSLRAAQIKATGQTSDPCTAPPPKQVISTTTRSVTTPPPSIIDKVPEPCPTSCLKQESPLQVIVRVPVPCPTSSPKQEISTVAPCQTTSPPRITVKVPELCPTSPPKQEISMAVPIPITPSPKVTQVPTTQPPLETLPTTAITTSMPTVTSPAVTSNCQNGKIYPSGTNSCGQFLLCYNRVLVLMICPTGQAFNYTTRSCEWADHVPGCSIQGH